jgi:tRNA-modifying protein YgfZ
MTVYATNGVIGRQDRSMLRDTFGFLPLSERGIVAITGTDAVPFLDNLVTNALDRIATGEARFAALLSPQGKIAHEFFVLRTSQGFLLDTPRASLSDLVKRLTLYKLRAKVTIKDDSDTLLAAVSVLPPSGSHTAVFLDPRSAALGYRIIARDTTLRLNHNPDDDNAYRRNRIAQGVPEAGLDYAVGDTFPHEANYDRLNGVSFTKGCFVGQEVVARMQNKTVVRKRIAKVVGEASLETGAIVLHGTGEIGRVGSVDQTHGLAMIRLDRALEAAERGEALTAGGVRLTVDPAELVAYKAAVAARPVIDL